ncbi:MAG: hypothetical protein M3075_08030 [Candidatus Dormibacteraeota bacterium]|jgi:hypothetical protein|nr:hypothetical protein [Candidatus Dormibacteraeota bacterium]
MSATSPEAGQVSPDGQFRWDGQQWVPLATNYREPTAWTRPLQLVTAAYLVIGLVYSVVTTALFLTAANMERVLRASNANLGGDQVSQAVNFSILAAWAVVIVLAVVSLLLAVGSFLGWRWVFWVALVWLALNSVGVLSNLNALANSGTQVEPAGVEVGSLLLSLVALGLFIWFVVALVRYGPWAMKKPGAPA